MTEPLPLDRKDWPEDVLLDWAERAGIMEFDGGARRALAEWRAEACIRKERGEVE